MTFRIEALPLELFTPLFALDDDALAARGARRIVTDGGAPCRVSLTDAAPGERVILTHYEHHAVATPFRASHAIFVREAAVQASPRAGDVPEQMRRRMMSLRAFDGSGMMLVADLADGAGVGQRIADMFADVAVTYIHLHYAKQGCFAAAVRRA